MEKISSKEVSKVGKDSATDPDTLTTSFNVKSPMSNSIHPNENQVRDFSSIANKTVGKSNS